MKKQLIAVLSARQNTYAEKEGKASKDLAIAIAMAERMDTITLENGIVTLSRIGGYVSDEFMNKVANTADKATSIPNKGVVKALELVEYFGSCKEKPVDNFLARAIVAIQWHAKKIKRGNANVNSSIFYLDDLRKAIGYKACTSPEEMDAFLDKSPDYGASTIMTQASQIKSVFIGLNLAKAIKGVKGSREAIEVNLRFCTEALKYAHGSRLDSRQG